MGTWSDPLVMTRGRKQLRVSVMAYDSITVAWKPSIFGYMSRGEMVPDVMTTLLNRSKTGCMAKDASRQLNSMYDSLSVGRSYIPGKKSMDTRQVEDGIRDRRHVGFERLEDE